MVGLVHRRVAPAGVGDAGRTRRSSGARSRLGAANVDVDAPAQVAEHRPAVALERWRSPRPGPRGASCPPSARGCSTRGRSSTPHGGKREAVAARASARSRWRPPPSRSPLLVPSRNELNICAFMSPARDLLRRRSRSGPTPSSGVEAWYAGRYLVPLPAATTSKPAARAQSTMLADQRRLVAVGERIDDARLRARGARAAARRAHRPRR